MKRPLAVASALVAAGVAAAAIIGLDRKPEPAEARPHLALLTSLPLVFGESFGLEAAGSPALSALDQRYVVQPIGVADAASLKGQNLLLMAHPLAQPADALVDLDQWVRDGGHLLLLADPKLDWPSERPLGDRLRAPLAFADTGLLKHWGLQLAGPHPDGPATAGNGDISVLAASPGKLSGAGCAILGDGFIARCRIGKGEVTVVADADFLNVAGPDALDGSTAQNLPLLMAELERLESR